MSSYSDIILVGVQEALDDTGGWLGCCSNKKKVENISAPHVQVSVENISSSHVQVSVKNISSSHVLDSVENISSSQPRVQQ